MLARKLPSLPMLQRASQAGYGQYGMPDVRPRARGYWRLRAVYQDAASAGCGNRNHSLDVSCSCIKMA